MFHICVHPLPGTFFMDVFNWCNTSFCILFCREFIDALWRLGPNLDWVKEACEQQKAAYCRVC